MTSFNVALVAYASMSTGAVLGFLCAAFFHPPSDEDTVGR
jgi:hypothetical protein